MALTTSTPQLLQELYVLATGRAANTADMVQIEALVGADGDLTQINALIDLKVGLQAQQLGVNGMVQAIAKNGFGLVLSDAQTSIVVQQLMAGGINSWSKLFTWLEAHEGTLGTTLDNRGEASVYFTNLLATAGKSSLFAGSSVSSAVTTLLQNIGSSATSLGNAEQGFGQLAVNLTANGITSAVIDGYVRGATVFADDNGNGVLDAGEWSTTTNANGNYVLPLNITAGSIIAFGGTDIMTNLAFQGVLTAPAGSTVINPITTLVQALLDSGESGTVAQATTAIRVALGLPTNIDLLSYDPLAVLADSTASAPAQSSALTVQTILLQLANVMTQAGNAIDSAAANGTGTLQSASASVTSALASTIAAATGPIDLSNTTTLNAVIQTAATLETTNTGGTQLTTTQIGQIATLTAASNTAAADATTITELAQVAVVSQGSATDAIISGTSSGGNLNAAVVDFTGANLDSAIAQAQPGEVPSGTPAPAPAPAPAPTFTVAITGNAVSFDGTATGDISVAIDHGVATFVRGGVTAGVTVDNLATRTIAVGAGQTLVIDAADAGAVAATPFTGTGTLKSPDLTAAQYAGLHLTGFTGTQVVTLAAGTANASDLVAIDARSAEVINASALTAIQGNAAGVLAVYNSAGGFSGLGNEALTVSGSASATQVETILVATTGTVSVGLSNFYNDGSVFSVAAGDVINIDPDSRIDDLAATPVSSVGIGIAGQWNFTAGVFTWSDTWGDTRHSLTLTGITAIEVGANTITIPAGALSVSGSSSLVLSGGSGPITLTRVDGDFIFSGGGTPVTVPALGVTAIAIPSGRELISSSAILATFTTLTGAVTVNDTAAVTVLNTIDAATTGTVTATVSEGSIATLATLTGTNAYTITVTDPTVVATSLTALDALTTVPVIASGITTLTGSVAELGAVYVANTAGTITGLGDEALTLTDTSVSVAALILLEGRTTGLIDAATVTAVTATIGNLVLVFTGRGRFGVNIDVNVTGTASVADLNIIDGKHVRTITAVVTEHDMATLLTLTGTGNNYSITLNDTSAAAASLNTLDGKTDSVINAASALTISGSAADIKTAIASSGITTAVNYAATVSGTTSVADANLIDADTTGVVTATISAGDVATLLGLTGTGNAYTIVVGDASVAADSLVTLDAKTTVAINATAVTTLTGSATSVGAVLVAGGITLPDNFSTVLTGVATAAEILAIQARDGTGTIDGSALTAINGSAADVVSAYAALAAAPGSFESALSGTATPEQIALIDGYNSNGTLTLSGIDVLAVSATASIAALNAGAAFAEALTMTGAGIEVTMTRDQHQAFTTITASGTTDSIKIITDGAINAAASIETYLVASAASNHVIVNAGKLDVNITGKAASSFTTTVTVGGNTVTGNYYLNHSSNADEMIATNGANVSGVNSGGSIGAEILQLSGTITMTVAQHNDYTYAASHFGIHAGGSNDTVVLANAGTIIGQAQVETYVLAAGTNSFTTRAVGQINAAALTDGQVLTLAGTHAATISLGAGDLTSTSSGNITVNATTGSNVITLGAGNDKVTGGDGDDVIDFGTGANTVVIGTVATHGIDLVKNFGADDVIQFSAAPYIGSAGNQTGTLLSALNGVASFSANSSVGFTHGGADYILINVGGAGYDAAEDAVIKVELVGVSFTLYSLTDSAFTSA